MWLFCCVVPALAAAQHPTIVVTPRSDFSEQVAERLRAGSDAQATVLSVVVDDAARDCETEPTSDTAHATITIRIETDQRIELCVRSRGDVSRRVLGPLPALDATAVEQVATIAEASLEALQALDEPNNLAPAVANTAPEPNPEPTADLTLAPTPSPPTAVLQVSTPRTTPPAADVHEPVSSERGWMLRASYQPTLWNADTIAHALHVGAQVNLSPTWLWIGAGLSGSLPFDQRQSGLGASFGAVALDLRLGAKLTLGPNASLNLSLGPRVEWLFVGPFEEDANGARAAPSSDAFSLGSVIELGPTIQISGNVSAAFGLGLLFTHNARNYVVTQGDAHVQVMDQSIPRPYVHLGAQLAL